MGDSPRSNTSDRPGSVSDRQSRPTEKFAEPRLAATKAQASDPRGHFAACHEKISRSCETVLAKSRSTHRTKIETTDRKMRRGRSPAGRGQHRRIAVIVAFPHGEGRA